MLRLSTPLVEVTMRDGWVTDTVAKFSDGWDKWDVASHTQTNTFREIQLGEKLSNRHQVEVTTAGVTKQTHTGLICVCVVIMYNDFFFYFTSAYAASLLLKHAYLKISPPHLIPASGWLPESAWKKIAADKLCAQAANHQDAFKTFSPLFHSADFLPLTTDPFSCRRCKCQPGMSKI